MTKNSEEYRRALIEEQAALDALIANKSKSNFLSFMRYVYPTDPKDSTKSLFATPWHIRLLGKEINRAIRKLEKGESTYIIVSMPPRHGKSEIWSRYFPAYFMGKFPDMNVIAISHTDTLARKMAADVRRIMSSEEYAKIFPNSSLVGKRTSKDPKRISALEFDILGGSGKYFGAGVKGGVTGSGAKLLIVDDPIKNDMEANSPTIRDQIDSEYTNTIRTRFQPPGVFVIVQTRWHEDDLAGRRLRRLEKRKRDGTFKKNAPYNWRYLRLPALTEEIDIGENRSPFEKRESAGEALWEEVFSAEYLEEIRDSSPIEFSKLYQQRPERSGGKLFIREHFDNRYEKHPRMDIFDEVCFSCDLSFGATTTSASYNVVQAWGRAGENFYLLHQLRERGDINIAIEMLRTMHTMFPTVAKVIVEEKANGAAVLALLRDEIPGLMPFNPRGSKYSRAQTTARICAQGRLIVPAWGIAPWISDFVEEHVQATPESLQKRHHGINDDQIDCASQMLAHWVTPEANMQSDLSPSLSTYDNFLQAGAGGGNNVLDFSDFYPKRGL